ncbi:MAG: hypothetical protein HQL91_06190 [Magnetococcales bacterium]|nr:hypothetical protein [Magnetococcales bacterium]
MIKSLHWIWIVSLVLLSACSANEVGRSVYQSLEQKKCLDEQGSYGLCTHQATRP